MFRANETRASVLREMKANKLKVKHLLPALLAVLSLFALSAPTCLCSHHESDTHLATSQVSCHEAADTGMAGDAAEIGENCICVFAERPRAADRSAPVKIVKVPAALASDAPAEVAALFTPFFSASAEDSAIRLYERRKSEDVYSRGPPIQTL
jgi:hypothetical protein